VEITRELVVSVASLAKVTLTEDRVDYYQDQMSKILSYVEQISFLDQKIKDLDSDQDSAALVAEREDEPLRSLAAVDVLEQASNKKGRYFQVPRIID
jgi:aspartyl-tRNA(Asn)/glutamyl-tRNA(Gln) amidotransferase subunit C